MKRNDRAIDKKELLTFISKTQGVTASTLVDIFGNPKSIYPVLSSFVKGGFLNKKILNRDTIYFSEDFDLGKVFEIEMSAKIFDYLSNLDFILGDIAYDDDCILIHAVKKDDTNPEFYKFRVVTINQHNVDSYQTKNRDYIDILVIDDLSLITKIKGKQESGDIIRQLKEGQIRKDILMYSVITNSMYTVTNQKQVAIIDSYEKFNYIFKGRRAVSPDECTYYLRLYHKKTNNKLKYSRRG